MTRVELTKQAEKDLARIPKNDRKKIARKLLLLQQNPLAGKKLGGKLTGSYSLKTWPYRIIYLIQKHTDIIYILVIEHRQGVYK